MAVCHYFLKGDCRFGDKCRYEHPSAKKKTVCPYFLKGYCRYGDNCRNEHPRDGVDRQTDNRASSQWSSNSYHRSQNRFDVLSSGDGAFGEQHSRPADSEQTIQQTVKSDMEIWERSKQWPLSCYTNTKEEPSFQGLLDFSPEEIRFEAYSANAKGNADVYERGLKQLISASHNRRQHLSKMTVSQIQEEIKKNSKPHGSVVMDAGLSMQQPSSGVFGNSGSFGQIDDASDGSSFVMQSSGLFATGNPINQSGLFGQTIASLTNSGTVFSSSPTSGTVFNSSPNTGTVFSSSPNTGTVFGVSNQASSVDNTNHSTGLFPGSPVVQSSAGVPVFGSVPPVTSSGSVSTGPKPQTDNNLLNSNQGTSSSTEKSSTVASSTGRQTLIHSEQDIQAFMADSFVLGKIPECPPPLELC